MNKKQLTVAVFREFGIIQERMDVNLKKSLPKDLPSSQFKLLNHLRYTKNKDETASDIAINSQVSLSAMSQVIKQLVSKKYLQLEARDNDSRKKNIILTNLGRAAHKKAISAIEIDLDSLTSSFSLTELKQLHELSNRFRTTFEG